MGNWNKIKRVLQYIFGTIDLIQKLSDVNKSVVKWWLDAAYIVHAHLRSHTETTMPIELGSIYRKSTK